MDIASLADHAEERRQLVSARLDGAHRALWGQFFTPPAVARLLADLIELPTDGRFSLLDPGAGVGSLSAAVATKAIAQKTSADIHIVAVEADPEMVAPLQETLLECERAGEAAGVSITTELRPLDFLEWASASIAGSVLAPPEQFSACVMNPPYRKINTGTSERLALERIGLRVTNLYAAFMALASVLLEPGGQLSAITPRSFANGPYFLPFRQFFLDRMALDFLHVFESRGRVFADADVLQENVVLHAVNGGEGNEVTLSVSLGFDDARIERAVMSEQVVRPDDPQMFVHIPVDEVAHGVATSIAELPSTLGELGVQVSTGRVVDFRTRDNLLNDPDPDAAPLIYPTHLRRARVEWPLLDGRKPNALAINRETEALLMPAEHYVLVKRFSSKEERRRVVAAVASPDDTPGDLIAFENHLNVFHIDGNGLHEELALGLCAFLNSSAVDTYIRQFSGHTQINATDLRLLRYPTRDCLVALGELLLLEGWPGDQASQDELVYSVVPSLAGQQDAPTAVG